MVLVGGGGLEHMVSLGHVCPNAFNPGTSYLFEAVKFTLENGRVFSKKALILGTFTKFLFTFVLHLRPAGGGGSRLYT